MSDPLILVTCRQMQVELPHHRDRLEALGYRVVAPDLGNRQQFTAQELLEYRSDLTGIIAGDDELSDVFFAAATQLRAVIRWGIGMDSVDMKAARRRGVSVTNTPGVFDDEVADAAFGYILNLARGFITVDAAVRDGQWPKVEGVTLAGSQLGIVGLGAIGRAVAKRAVGFGMEVVAYDPFVQASPQDVTITELDPLLAESRFVVLTCPLTEQTYHLIKAERLNLMRTDSYLVNVARGQVVQEQDLVDSLSSGGLAGAALDVFEVEPLPMDSPLRTMTNVVLGAHNASNTREGVARASAKAVDLLVEALR